MPATATATQTNAVTKNFMFQIADWDKLEGCWEIHVPFPRKVNVAYNTFDEALDASQEIHALLQEHGISYSNFAFVDQVMTVSGLDWS